MACKKGLCRFCLSLLQTVQSRSEKPQIS